MITIKNRGNRPLALAGIFTAAVLSTHYLGGCAAVPQSLQTVRMVPLEEKQKQGYWSIFVVSDCLFDVPVLPDPVHNFIRVHGPNESDPYATLHGVCLDRKTGDMPWMGDHSHGLFAIVQGDTTNYSEKNTFAATEIFCGSQIDVTRKLLIAMDAMNFINRQNLVYHAFDIFSTGQNSNSVAYTLVRAMGCAFPDENTRQAEPGNGRMLLPAGWSSVYENWVFPSEDPVFLEWYVNKVRRDLEENVRDIMESGPPPHSRPVFFDSTKPFAAYQPLIIQDAFDLWQTEIAPPLPLNILPDLSDEDEDAHNPPILRAPESVPVPA